MCALVQCMGDLGVTFRRGHDFGTQHGADESTTIHSSERIIEVLAYEHIIDVA